MQRYQTDKLNSHIKSHDVLTNNAAELVGVPEIAIEAALLKDNIDAVVDAAGIAGLDNTGYSEDKRNKRAAVMNLLQIVTRAAAAYYNKVGNTAMLRKAEFVPTEFVKMRDTDFYVQAKVMYQVLLPDAANLIGADATTMAALNTANEAYFAALEAPKDQIEIAKVATAQIDPLLAQGDELRRSIDIYMQTFADDKPELFALWRLSLHIDNTGASNPPVLVVAVDAAPLGAVTSVDFAGVTMVPSMEIKFRNQGPAPIFYGFAPNPQSLPGQPSSLNPGADIRRSAASMGYDANSLRFLNLRNDGQVDSQVVVEFYEMD